MRPSMLSLSLSLVLVTSCGDDRAASPPDVCPDLIVATPPRGLHPTRAGGVGAACELLPDPDGGIGSNCLDQGAACLTESFGFPGGACVTIDQCDVATQTGCPAGAGCYEVNDHRWCFHGCADDLDCRVDEGYRCQGGGCFPGCKRDEDCPPSAGIRLACDVGNGRCIVDDGCPATACSADKACVPVGTDGGARCLARCDLAAQDCPGDQACTLSPEGVPVCAPAGLVARGESCGEWDACERGSVCAAGSCEPICDPHGECTCSAAQAMAPRE
jgi:hypothetical protein